MSYFHNQSENACKAANITHPSLGITCLAFHLTQEMLQECLLGACQ